MVKDHTDIERGNPLLAHELLFLISSKGSFYMHHPTDRITHSLCYTSREALAGTRNSSMGHHGGSIRRLVLAGLPLSQIDKLGYAFIVDHSRGEHMFIINNAVTFYLGSL